MMHTRDLLDKYFDTAFAATDGVKRLRELILSLAMRGKLVPQISTEQPARELLKEIEAEKNRLVKEGKIKKSTPLPEITPDEIPYDLPDSWKWTQLGKIAVKLTDGSHNPPKNAGSGLPMLSSQNVNFGTIDFSTPSRYVSEEDFIKENKRTQIKANDILLTIVASLGRPAVVPVNAPKFVLQRSVAVISSPIDSEFLCKQLASPLCTDYYLEHAKGTAQKGIYLGQLSIMPIVIPPLEEQRRIVERIDSLMMQCDRLESLRNQRDKKRLIVHAAASHKLLQAKDQQEFGEAWGFIGDRFGDLYTVKENVSELRKAILQLAVMGKLVPQDPNDPPASELLKDIEAEKQRLIKEGEIKKQKPLPEIMPNEILYNLPNSWVWIRLEKLTQVITKGSSPKWQGVKYVNENEGILFITSENVGNYNLLLNKKKFVEPSFNEIEPRSILRKKDILMNIVGASIGRTAIFELDELANINQAVSIIRLIGQVNYQYFLHFFNSPICINYMFDKQVDNARANLSMGNISLFKIPLPPLPEQHRIVAKVDRLMEMCDRLEAKIAQSSAKQTSLLNAIMEEVSGK